MWVDARFVKSEENNRRAEPIEPERARSAKLASDAVFLSAQGCDEPQSLQLDWEGLGTVKCTREAYAKMVPEWDQYAPKIYFNDDGEIIKMANHYHP